MKICISIFAFLFSTLVSATPLHKIVVFGDSLSDNGNLYEYMKHQLPVSPPYHKGRFSNGPVWIELLAAEYFPADFKNKTLQVHLHDYAYGGASVEDEEGPFTLKGQIDSYFLVNKDKAEADNLYVIWIGSNNYLALADNMQTEPVINGINTQLQRLVDQGAKHFLIVNLPDLGKIPLATAFDASSLLSNISNKHNYELASSIDMFQKNNPSTKWTFLDVNDIFKDMVEGKYQFINITEACSTNDDDGDWEVKSPSVLKMVANITRAPQKNCDEYLFFDEVHPTGPAHKIMAMHAKRLLDKAGEIFS